MSSRSRSRRHSTSSDLRRILVAVKDPWARSLPAIDKAIRLARALGAELQLFHAMAEPVYVDVADAHGESLIGLERERMAKVAARLELLAGRLARGAVAVTTAAAWDFPAHEAVIRAAQRFKADLIVAERHATSHHLPWLLRFTDFELLRLSAVPVLLVKTRDAYVRPQILAAIDPSHAYAKPLRLDAEILRYGSAISQALRGTLHAVYAFDPLPVGTMPDFDGGMTADIEEVAQAQARVAFERALRSVRVPPSRRHLVARHPTDAIEEVAGAIDAGIVVMGAISRSGLKRLVLGNTAEKLLDQLPRDVLIVKPKRFRNRIPRARRGPQLIALSTLQAGI